MKLEQFKLPNNSFENFINYILMRLFIRCYLLLYCIKFVIFVYKDKGH